MNADKRRKLLDLEAMRRRLPHVSQRGLASTLKDIKKHGLPELDDTRDLRAAREMLMNEKTPYGPISVEKEVPASGGGSVRIRMASPLALLFFIFSTVHHSQASLKNDSLSAHRRTKLHGI